MRTVCVGRTSTNQIRTDSVIYSPYHEEYLPDSDCDLVTSSCLFDTHEEAAAVLEEWKASGSLAGGEECFGVLEYQINVDSF